MFGVLLLADNQLVMNIFDEKSNKHKLGYNWLIFNVLNNNKKPT